MLVNLFDIDGCIMPSIFDNYQRKDSKIDLSNRKEYVKITTEYLEKNTFYPEFVKYYKNLNYSNTCYNYFITGRKRSEYGNITIRQLSDLIFDVCYFYPETLKHEKVEYSIWKYETIKNIIYTFIRYENINKEKPFFYIVYDDNTEYYNSLRYTFKNVPIDYHWIINNESWKRLLNNL